VLMCRVKEDNFIRIRLALLCTFIQVSPQARSASISIKQAVHSSDCSVASGLSSAIGKPFEFIRRGQEIGLGLPKAVVQHAEMVRNQGESKLTFFLQLSYRGRRACAEDAVRYGAPQGEPPFSIHPRRGRVLFSQLDFKDVVNFYVFAIFCMSLCTIKRAALHRKKIGALYHYIRAKNGYKEYKESSFGMNGTEWNATEKGDRRLLYECKKAEKKYNSLI